MDRYTQAYVDELKDFIDAVVNDKPTPINAVDGIRSVEIALAAKRSAESGKVIRL